MLFSPRLDLEEMENAIWIDFDNPQNSQNLKNLRILEAKRPGSDIKTQAAGPYPTGSHFGNVWFTQASGFVASPRRRISHCRPFGPETSPIF